VLARLSPRPKVLALSPRTLADVWSDIIKVGGATGRIAEAEELVSRLTAQISEPVKMQKAEQPRVLSLEWLDPPFVAGHWVPEMVALAGGIDLLGHAGQPGYEVSWQTAVRSDPDLILAMPCGYHAPEVEKELREVAFPREWHSLRAVQNRSVFAMDASSHFSRPGPRIADGIVELRRLFEQVTRARTKKTAAKVLPVARSAQLKESR